VAGIGIFVDYPEGKVASPPAVTRAFQVSGNTSDLGYGFNGSYIKTSGLPSDPSPILTLSFNTCQAAPAAVAADFHCVVTDASDDIGNVLDPATFTCTVTVP